MGDARGGKRAFGEGGGRAEAERRWGKGGRVGEVERGSGVGSGQVGLDGRGAGRACFPDELIYNCRCPIILLFCINPVRDEQIAHARAAARGCSLRAELHKL